MIRTCGGPAWPYYTLKVAQSPKWRVSTPQSVTLFDEWEPAAFALFSGIRAHVTSGVCDDCQHQRHARHILDRLLTPGSWIYVINGKAYSIERVAS